MTKAYNRVNWADYPSTSTKVNAANLNKMDKGIDDIDDRVVTLDSTVSAQASTIGGHTNQIGALGGQLTANSNSIYMDYHDGKYGINTSAERGADTFIPFKSGGGIYYKSRVNNGNSGSNPLNNFTYTATESIKCTLYFHIYMGAVQTGSDTSQTHSGSISIKKNDTVLYSDSATVGIYMYNSSIVEFSYEDEIELEAGDTITINATHTGYGISNEARWGYTFMLIE